MRECTRIGEARGKPIQVRVISSGEDGIVLITGGDAPHVGSVSVARMEDGQVAVDHLVLSGHRDDEVSDRYAEALCRVTGHTVAAVCGIHYEAITPEELSDVIACTESILRSILDEERGVE